VTWSSCGLRESAAMDLVALLIAVATFAALLASIELLDRV
jgi:hypothetical protein